MSDVDMAFIRCDEEVEYLVAVRKMIRRYEGMSEDEMSHAFMRLFAFTTPWDSAYLLEGAGQ